MEVERISSLNFPTTQNIQMPALIEKGFNKTIKLRHWNVHKDPTVKFRVKQISKII